MKLTWCADKLLSLMRWLRQRSCVRIVRAVPLPSRALQIGLNIRVCRPDVLGESNVEKERDDIQE